MTDTDMLYMSSQAKRITDLENENRELKRLLKAACNDIEYLIKHAKRNGKVCDYCKYGNEMYCYADDCSIDAKWNKQNDAIKLIGGNDNG